MRLATIAELGSSKSQSLCLSRALDILTHNHCSRYALDIRSSLPLFLISLSICLSHDPTIIPLTSTQQTRIIFFLTTVFPFQRALISHSSPTYLQLISSPQNVFPTNTHPRSPRHRNTPPSRPNDKNHQHVRNTGSRHLGFHLILFPTLPIHPSP